MRILVFLALLTGMAWGGPTGELRGRIVDKKTGERAIGATVIVAGPALQAAAAEITDETGEYRIAALPPGAYVVTVYYYDVTVERSNVTVEPGKQGVVNLAIDTSQPPGEVIVIAQEHQCCGGAPCSMPLPNRRFELSEPQNTPGTTSAELPQGTRVGVTDRVDDNRTDDAERSHGGQLGLSARGVLGLRDVTTTSDRIGAVEIEGSYGITRRIELTIASRLPLTEHAHWHVAPGARLFPSKHTFVQPQLTLPTVGLSLYEGVWHDVDRRVGIYLYAAQSVEPGLIGIGAGLGAQGRY